MRPRRSLLVVVVAGAHLMLLCGFVAAQAGIRINLTSSVPRGVYRIAEQVPVPGDYVAVCPPAGKLTELALERGYVSAGGCAAGTRELLKVLAAREGDHVGITGEGVAINGSPWPASAPLSADRAGRLLPRLQGFDRALSESDVLVMSEDCPTGFDSRYFGPVSRENVTGVAMPVLLW